MIGLFQLVFDVGDLDLVLNPSGAVPDVRGDEGQPHHLVVRNDP